MLVGMKMSVATLEIPNLKIEPPSNLVLPLVLHTKKSKPANYRYLNTHDCYSTVHNSQDMEPA